MRLLILGAGGIVGRAVAAEAARRDWAASARPRAEVDVGDPAVVAAALAASGARLVINCAAFTRVDDCEHEADAARRINDLAVGTVAAACAHAGARLVHLSTDYVFDGESAAPYGEEATPAPLSVYGASKLAGEARALAHADALVVRTSAVFGRGGANFVDTIAARLRQSGEPLRVVADQVTCPTYAPFLARALLDLGESAATGRIHYRNREAVSWFELARAVARELGSGRGIEPVPTAEYPRPARRPRRSVLAVERFEAICGRRVEPWSDGLREHLAAAREERR